jgi:hypothetical protein
VNKRAEAFKLLPCRFNPKSCRTGGDLVGCSSACDCHRVYLLDHGDQSDGGTDNV